MYKNLFLRQRRVQVTLLLTVVLSLISSVALIALMTLLSRVVAQVFISHADIAKVEPLLLILLGVIALRSLLTWVREANAQLGSIHVKTDLRERVFSHLLLLGPAYTQGERTGELVTTLTTGVERLDAYISRYLPQVYLSALIPLLIAIYIFSLDWISSVLLLVTAPIIPLLMVLVGSYAERLMKRQWEALSRMSATFLDSMQGLTTLKLFGRSQREHRRIWAISEEFGRRTLRVLRIASLSGAVLEFMSSIAIGLVAVTLGIRLLNRAISFEHAFLILLLAPEFYRPLRDLGTHRHAGMEGKAAAERLLEILQTPLPVKETGASPAPSGPLSVEISDLSFSYPGHEQAALEHLSLALPAGSCTALVGRSGAGKSTLVNLLLRFRDLQSGSILVNDLPLSLLSVERWREMVALVPQRPYLFYGSVRENLRLARPMATDEEVEQAAILAGADGFIHELSQGYETQIGERAARLSAGQAQRLAIARAFLKDAPLLILDEPTSNLDPQSETLIRESLQRLIQGRTVLVIAHRYNTIAQADRVAVLDAGRVVESGTLADLRSGFSPFAQLLSGYRKGETQA